MSWKEVFILFAGLVLGKVVQDSLPVLDVRPPLRKIMSAALKQLGLILIVLSMFRLKNSVQLVVMLLVAVPLIAIISQLIKLRLERSVATRNNEK